MHRTSEKLLSMHTLLQLVCCSNYISLLSSDSEDGALNSPVSLDISLLTPTH